jgi:transposase
MDELYKVITKQKPCDLMETDHVFWDVELVRKYANNKYNINYTYSGMWKIVREKFELNYITPFSKDYRKPDNAVEILKKDLKKSLKLSTKKKQL